MDVNKNNNSAPDGPPPISQVKPSRDWEDVYRAQTNEIHRLDGLIASLRSELAARGDEIEQLRGERQQMLEAMADELEGLEREAAKLDALRSRAHARAGIALDLAVSFHNELVEASDKAAQAAKEADDA